MIPNIGFYGFMICLKCNNSFYVKKPKKLSEILSYPKSLKCPVCGSRRIKKSRLLQY